MTSLSKEIIELLNKKQEAAFEVVFNLYYPRLVYFAKEYVPYEEAKGLVQDAFISFWEKNPFISNELQFQSFLYTTVKNNCLMRLRHEKVVKNHRDKSIKEIQNQIYLSALEQMDTSVMTFQEIEIIIKKTIADLPPRCREIFILSRFEGRKNQEIAEKLEISVKSVEAQITKVLKILKIALKDFFPIIAYLLVSSH